MYLQNSTVCILSNTTVYWENNCASRGGAIYVQDASPLIYCTSVVSCLQKQKCFFQLPGQNLSNGIDVQLVFTNNFADVAGSVLYGGAIDNCKLTGLDSYKSGDVFDMLVDIDDDNTNSNISSDPFRICPCENNYTDCSMSISKHLYRGETFTVSVVAVGQREGTVPATVRSITDSGATLERYQSVQEANNNCTALNYTVFTSYSGSLVLYADGPCSTSSDVLNISLTIYQTCPPGFNISELSDTCICEERLQEYTNECNIINGLRLITRNSDKDFWVGYDSNSEYFSL